MKHLIILSLLLSATYTIKAQIFNQTNDLIIRNQVRYDSTAGTNVMVGYLNTEGLMNFEEFSGDYHLEFNSYIPVIDSLTPYYDSFPNIQIAIVLGTWCSDSRREVPRFLKLLTDLNFPMNNAILVGVDRKKVCDLPNVEELNIEFVPTIIFYRNGIEIGRIIESPNETLEADFLAILRGR